jgi:hypothetical protein
MAERQTRDRARRARRAGKRPTTQAGEFVREEIHHVREGKHGARSPAQAIAIGLSKARRAGVKLGPPPRRGKKTTRRSTAPASRGALARQARQAARRRGPAARKRAARKAAVTRRKAA